VRKELIWLIVHPDEERIFVQPRPITKSRGENLRAQGCMIYKVEVTLPPVTDVAPTIEGVASAVTEQWPQDDAPDAPQTK
jgi:hypothetical protein